MALTKKDLENIGKVIDERIDAKVPAIIDAKVPQMIESTITREIGLLRLEMNQRFDEASIENKNEHQEILQKIKDINQMETEDIQVVYEDIRKIKKKIGMGY